MNMIVLLLALYEGLCTEMGTNGDNDSADGVYPKQISSDILVRI